MIKDAKFASRTALVWVLAITLLFGISCAQKANRPQNIVLLIVDTLRADHIGVYGYDRETTPNLDRFAEDSVVFMNHYAQASRTGPSVANIFTGLHGRSHGVVNPLNTFNGIGLLETSRDTLAEHFTNHGYLCRAVVSNPNVYPDFGFAQGFETYLPLPIYTDAMTINEQALQWIHEIGDQPFLLYLHYMEPHSPYGAPPPLHTLFVDPEYSGEVTGDHAQLDEILTNDQDLTLDDRQQLKDLYDQNIFLWDREFGRLIQALKTGNRLDNTIVVVVSDHGEEFCEHGGLLHGYTLFEEQLRVPLVIFAPGFAPGRVLPVTRNIDLLPTLLSLAGLPVLDAVQGKSMNDLMRGGQEEDRVVFSETGIRAAKTVKLRSYQSQGWKYIETLFPLDQPPKLFDLSNDPAEENDLFETHQQKVESLRKEMADFLKVVPQVESKSILLDQEGLEQLRQLGYVGQPDQ